MTFMPLPRVIALVTAITLTAAPAAFGDRRSQALSAEAYTAAYNLDYVRAADLFKQAIAADPNDAAAYRGAAALAWLQVLFFRGTVQVEDYLGRMSSSDVKMPNPPADLNATFRTNVDRAIALGEAAVARRDDDASAHYALGAGLALVASYSGSVEGKMFAALRAARRAYAEHERTLALDPKRKDASLVVGTYRYIISTLPMVMRAAAYVVGFSGGKEEGIRLVQEAAEYDSDVRSDAQFALVIIYSRERRYDDALRTIQALERTYPQNRLLVLEEGSASLRAKRPADAERVLDAGIAALQQDPRPRMPGEEGRWRFKRGVARLQLGKLAEAEADLTAATAAPGVPDWLRGRIRLETGKLADLLGNRDRAEIEYRAAIGLANRSSDPEAEAEARRYLAQPYKR
jgi:tetratricopeptide (TPR) repeat protein